MSKTYRKKENRQEADGHEPVRRDSEWPILTQKTGLKTRLIGLAGPLKRGMGRLLEQDCLLCAANSADSLLCGDCAAELRRLDEMHCPRCAVPTSFGEICGRCLAKPPHYDATLAAYHYDFPVDKLIQSFKYGHRLALGAYFGRQLAALSRNIAADVIIPLPLHPQRLRERGFNQALELARPVGAALGLPIDTTSCIRTRNTPAQAHLDWRERVKNIRGAFHCSTDCTGKRVILVDDVMTSGASLDECARTLKLHGAAEITLLVVARAIPKPM
ncbi:ComF family protein [Propionivibrio sp.]|uniref:ComF family protein n=1 Tax=Propionivibrio sp. TaxID=2212460 RepID=UPI00262941FB|nr:ComF family protein [Propionivibrio sp.]